MRKTGELTAGLFFTFIGIGVIIEGLRLHLGTITEPLPGFFPFLSGVTLAGLSSILLVRAFYGPSQPIRSFKNLWRPAILIAGLVFYISIFDLAGYIISTLILAFIILRIMDTKPWWVIVLASLILAVGSYFLFDRLLDVSLPGGLLKGLV
jgi:putative tricarboxylic transport membrane protein